MTASSSSPSPSPRHESKAELAYAKPWAKFVRWTSLLITVGLFVYNLITNIRYAITLESSFDPSAKLNSLVTSASQSVATFPVYSTFLVLLTVSNAYQYYYMYWLYSHLPPFKVMTETIEGFVWWGALNVILGFPNVVLTMIGIPNLVLSMSDWDASAQAIGSFGASSVWALIQLVAHAYSISKAEEGGQPAAPRVHLLLAVYIALVFGFVGVILAGWYFMFYGIAADACGRFFMFTMKWVGVILLLLVGYIATLLHAMSLSRTYLASWQDKVRRWNSNAIFLRIGSVLLIAAFAFCAYTSYTDNRAQWADCYDEKSPESHSSEFTYQSSPYVNPYTNVSSYDGAGPVHQSDVDRAVAVYTAATIISGIMAFFAACFLATSCRSDTLHPSVKKERRPNKKNIYEDIEMTPKGLNV